MKIQAKELLNETIENYNSTVGNMAKFKFDPSEVDMFTKMMEEFAKPDWINVLYDLPKNEIEENNNFIDCIFINTNSRIKTGMYNPVTKHFINTVFDVECVTHWMLLPSPPKTT